jgi:hypothetical protein
MACRTPEQVRFWYSTHTTTMRVRWMVRLLAAALVLVSAGVLLRSFRGQAVHSDLEEPSWK